jgi:hypothetical protein
MIMTTKAIHAQPVVTEAHRTPDEMAQCTYTHYNALAASSEWADTALHQPADDWKATADDLKANHQKLEDLLKQVAAARAQEEVLMRRWVNKAQACVTAVSTHCDGNADKVKNCGFGVGKRTKRPPAEMPTNVQPKKSKGHGAAGVTWQSDGRRHDYQVQWAQNPADPATYAQPAVVSKRKFELTGQTIGVVLNFRVRVIDAKIPAGYTDWTAWLAVTVT